MRVVLYQQHDLPVQVVPTPTAVTPQGWPAIFPERWAKPFPAKTQQFDLPVLAVYLSVVVTYPDGWQVVAPEKARRFKPFADSFAEGPAQGAIVSVTPQGWWPVYPERFGARFPVASQQFQPFPQYQVATATGYGWTVEFNYPARARKPVSAGADNIIATATAVLYGWSIEFPSARKRPVALTESALGAVSAGQTWGWASPITETSLRARQRLQSDASLIRAPVVVVTPSIGWMGEFSFKVRPRYGVADFGVFVRVVGTTIIATPALQGGDSAPSLDGTMPTITLKATFGPVYLDGMVTR